VSKKSLTQYQREEKMVMIARMKAAKWPLLNLLEAMGKEPIAPEENVIKLREELSLYYHSKRILRARNMGEIVKASLLEILRVRI